MQFLNNLWNDVFREPITAIIMALVVPYIVALGNRMIARVGLQNEALVRDALHKAAENGVNLAITNLGGGLSAALQAGITTAVVDQAMDYVKNMNPKGLKKLRVDDNALKDIVKSKIGKKMIEPGI